MRRLLFRAAVALAALLPFQPFAHAEDAPKVDCQTVGFALPLSGETQKLCDEANAGVPEAQLRLGLWLQRQKKDIYGVGSPIGVALVRSAADKGNNGARAALAHYYATGLGVPVDFAETLRLSHQAAAASANPIFKVFLADYLGRWHGAPPETKESLDLLHQAANAGDGSAMLALAQRHLTGLDGAQPDPEAAYTLLRRATESPSPQTASYAHLILGFMASTPEEARTRYEKAAQHSKEAEHRLKNIDPDTGFNQSLAERDLRADLAANPSHAIETRHALALIGILPSAPNHAPLPNVVADAILADGSFGLYGGLLPWLPIADASRILGTPLSARDSKTVTHATDDELRTITVDTQNGVVAGVTASTHYEMKRVATLPTCIRDGAIRILRYSAYFGDPDAQALGEPGASATLISSAFYPYHLIVETTAEWDPKHGCTLIDKYRARG